MRKQRLAQATGCIFVVSSTSAEMRKYVTQIQADQENDRSCGFWSFLVLRKS